MTRPIFPVSSLTLTSSGSAVSSYLPYDVSSMKLPTQVVVKATGQGAYVRLSGDGSLATSADVLVQAGDHVVMSVSGRQWVSVLSDGASSKVSIGALSTGVWGNAVVPALSISFINATTLDSRVTFSRGTNATLTDSNGRIAWAPHNLLTNSEDFEAAAWTKNTGTITANATTAPDGTTTADKFINATTANGIRFITQTVASSIGVFSVYAKAAEESVISLWLVGASVGAVFNLANGTFTLNGATSAQITPEANGFYRCTVYHNTATTTAHIYLRNGSAYTPTSASDGVFLWGAQLNVGSAAQSYNSTTPKNLLGFTQEPENAAWTKSNSYVQQNLLTYSAGIGGTGWTGSGTISFTLNNAVAPDNTQTATLVSLSTVGNNYVYAASVGAAGTQYTFSVWLSGSGTTTLVFYDNVSVFQTTTITLTSSLTRYTFTATFGVGSTDRRVGFGNVAAGTATTIVAWGAQLVQGSTAGDYTQTTSAAAPTRYLNWDGTLTGRKLVEDTVNAFHGVYTLSTLVAGTRYTQSVYAKAGERQWMMMAEGNNVTASAWFNLSTGVVGTVSGTGTPTATITNVGGGWYRCSLSYTPIANAGNTQARATTGDNVSTYTGDGTSGIYVSDFQLSNSASVDPYVYNPQAAAASAAYYGPRFDYNPTGSPIPSGVELVTNGTFDSASGWSTGGAWVISGGAASVTASAASLSQSTLAAVVGRTYQVTFTISSFTSGAIRVEFGGVNGTSRNAAGTYTQYITASSTAFLVISPTTTSTLSVDNISVQEVTGYTATANGLLIEETRTNLQIYSEDFTNAAYRMTGLTPLAGQSTAPNGQNTANLITGGGVGTPNFDIYPTDYGLNLNSIETFSLYVKQPATNAAPTIQLDLASTGSVFDTATGAITNASGGGPSVGATATRVGNGWWRFTVTTIKTNQFHYWAVRLPASSSASLLIWGAQLEVGSFATSYIPTVASQVTRNADSASMLGDNFYTWYNPNQGTLGVESLIGSKSPSSYGIYAVDDGTTNNAFPSFYTSTVNANSRVSAANVFTSVSSSLSATPATFKQAFAYAPANYASAFNGAAPTTQASGAIPGGLIRLQLGSYNSFALNGHIRSIRYYNTRLPDSTLQALTT